MKPSIEKIAEIEGSAFACKSLQLPVFDCPFHYHPEIELTHVSSSFGQRIVGDAIDSFEPGDLVLLGPNLPHLYYNDLRNSKSSSWARASVLQFKEDCLGKSFGELRELGEIADMVHRCKRGIRFLGKAAAEGARMLEELNESKGVSRLTLFLELLGTLAQAEEWENLASLAYCPLLNAKHEDRINRSIAYMYEHHVEELRLAKVASLAGMSPESFSRFFKKATGKTFIGFLNELRISSACSLIQQSDLTITEICFACGFSNLSNFNRRFKKIKDMTPAEYRKKSLIGSA
ncbi:MAG: AraC family transcriptional regulator [Opitutae bacterium]|nr:AraC family transcriptional regulator [Opitutae bacterium]